MGYSLSSAASATLEAFNDRHVSGSSNTYYAETTGAEMFYEIGLTHVSSLKMKGIGGELVEL